MDEIFVVGIDKAIFLEQATPGGHFCFRENSEYRTLALMPVITGKGGKEILPLVSKDRINWEICVCGTDAIDLFIDTDEPVCHCNLNEYRYVSVKRGGTNVTNNKKRKTVPRANYDPARWRRVPDRAARDRARQVQDHDYKKKSESILRRAG